MASDAWKKAERQCAKELGGERISRGDNFARSDVDVAVPDFPEMKVDCKYRQRHAHHTFVAEILKKYCNDPAHEPVLITKSKRQVGAFVTVRLSYFGELLDRIRAKGET